MIVEILTTGSELLLGQIINTNAAWLAAELNKIGFDVVYQSTVGDNRLRMAEAVRHALSRADIVITSGGLGPTRGDITKEICAEVCGLSLYEDAAWADKLREFFARRKKAMTANNLRQAMIPEGAHIFQNYCGTAPGVAMEWNGRLIINLPGPPAELQDMFTRSVRPYLGGKYGFDSVIVSRVLNTWGIGESELETKIMDLILGQKNPTLALLVRDTGVIVRITAKAATEPAARSLIAPVEKRIRELAGAYIYAADDEPLEKIAGRLLREKKLTVACAESCTGGLVSGRLTAVPGSSEYVRGGIVSYTNEVKKQALGVAAETLARHGAVSAETAKEMARGICRTLGSDIGVSVTGNAGPDASENKPVGLVYIGLCTPDGTAAAEYRFSGTREIIRNKAVMTALSMLRQYLEAGSLPL